MSEFLFFYFCTSGNLTAKQARQPRSKQLHCCHLFAHMVSTYEQTWWVRNDGSEEQLTRLTMALKQRRRWCEAAALNNDEGDFPGRGGWWRGGSYCRSCHFPHQSVELFCTWPENHQDHSWIAGVWEMHEIGSTGGGEEAIVVEEPFATSLLLRPNRLDVERNYIRFSIFSISEKLFWK